VEFERQQEQVALDAAAAMERQAQGDRDTFQVLHHTIIRGWWVGFSTQLREGFYAIHVRCIYPIDIQQSEMRRGDVTALARPPGIANASAALVSEIRVWS
jgi:hypothetical protein